MIEASRRGDAQPRKKVAVDSGLEHLALIARMQGFEVEGTPVMFDGLDLMAVRAESAEQVQAWSSRGVTPLLAVVPRRTRDGARRELLAAGATKVVDLSASAWELAAAIASTVFASASEQRRYERRYGNVRVLFRDVRGAFDGAGTLVGLGRSGAYVHTETPMGEGAEVELTLPDLGAVLRGRVAFTDPQGFALESMIQTARAAVETEPTPAWTETDLRDSA